MLVVVIILFTKVFSADSRELAIHRFESVNDSVTSGLQAITSSTYSFYQCKYIEDNVLQSNCDGFSCWESQLRDTTRVQILNVLDEFRSKVFDTHYSGKLKNTNYRNIFQMEWHWKLELESRNFLKDCPLRNRETNIVMNLDARNTELPRSNEQSFISFDCEMVATSFPVQSGSQTELISLLPGILDDNLLDDFDRKTDAYRRVDSLFVGCSYMLRNDVTTGTAVGISVIRGAVGHFACMFCAPQKVRIEKHCPHFTKNSEKHAKLCKLITNSTEMPCELNSLSCPLLEKSLTWMFTPKTIVGILYENQTFQLYSKKLQINVDTENRDSKYSNVKFPSAVHVTITPYVIHDDLYDRKFCIILILVFIFVLTLLILLLVLIYKNKLILQLYSQSRCGPLPSEEKVYLI